MAKGKAAEVQITPPNTQAARFIIRGKSPYVQNKFSAKAKGIIRATQEAGSTAKTKRQRKARNFQEDYEQAIHRFEDGGYGIPATGIRSALVSACRLVNFTMTRAKLSVFVEADGYDPEDMTPLVRITKGEPKPLEAMVRNESGVVDMRVRPAWAPGWEAVVTVKYDADQFTENDVANLLWRAGEQVGIGEGRNDSKKSSGMGWGQFEITNGDES